MNSKIKAMCECDAPYPEIRVECKNPSYARLLSLAYAGPDSELTAVLLYVYGRNMAKGKSPQVLSDVFRHVAAVEMRHIQMLGELIVLLGGEPRFSGPNRRVGVNTAMLGYACEPCQMIKNAVAGEENAIRLYNDLIRNIGDKCVRDVLKRIIMDEEQHLKLFRELLCGGLE